MPGFKSKAAKKGFNRPSAVAGQEVLREWRQVEAQDLQIGDIVAGMGLINTIYVDCRQDIYVCAGEANEETFSATHKILAFVRKVD